MSDAAGRQELINIPITAQDSLDAALRIQVEKRIKAESVSSSNYTSTIARLRDSTLNFTSKIDAAQNDGSSGSGGRGRGRDNDLSKEELVLMIKYLSKQVEDTWRSLNPAGDKVDSELNIAKLQGTKMQLTQKNIDWKRRAGLHNKYVWSLEDDKSSINILKIQDETNGAKLRLDILNLMNENEQFETEGKPEFLPMPPLVPFVWKDHEDEPKNGSHHHDNADLHSRSRKDQSIQLPDPRNSELKESINLPGIGRNSELKESIVSAGESAEVCVHADELNIHDVLSGRGHTVIFQSGNIYFRKLINILRNEYVALNNANEKKHFAKEIHDHIRSMDPPGRFLKKKSPGDPYVDIGVRLAIRKTSQALREGAPEIRELIDSGAIKVKIVTKAEFGALIEERSRQVYSTVYYAMHASRSMASESGAKGSEAFLPEARRSNHSSVWSSRGDNRNNQMSSHSASDERRPALSFSGHNRTNSFARFSEKQRKINSSSNLFGSSKTSRNTNLSPDSDIRGSSNGYSRSDLRSSESFDQSKSVRRQSKTLMPFSSQSQLTMKEYEEYAWKTRNTEYLEGCLKEYKYGNTKRRRSSDEKKLTYIHTCLAVDENESDEDETDSASVGLEFVANIEPLAIFDDTNHDAAKSETTNSRIIHDQDGDDARKSSTSQITDQFSKSSLNEDGNKTSLSESIINDASKRTSIRMSLHNRRSTRMSLHLRSSCLLGDLLDGFVDLEEDEAAQSQDPRVELPQQKTNFIPDIFESRRNKRRSSIIESSKDLLCVMYGNGAEESLFKHPERRISVIKNVISPSCDELLEEIHSPQEIR